MAAILILSFILYFMAAMPLSFGCGSSGSSRIRDQEVTTEVPVESPQTEGVTLSSNDDYYDYDLNDYDSSRYVKPHLRGDTTYPTIRDVSKLDIQI